MNKDTFLHLLQPTTLISSSDIHALEEIVEAYPYCLLAHFMVAKAHQQQAHPQVSETVKKAAVYAVNRHVLKKMLLVKPPETTATNIPEATAIPLPVYPVIQEVITEAETVAEPELTIDPPQIPLLEQEPVPSTIQNAEQRPADNFPSAPPKEIVTPEESTGIHIRRIDKTQQNEIINSFIKNEPRITSLHKTNRQIPEIAQDLSENSNTLPAGIISENLAGILIKQGKTDKAIDIYEKLILKYPQKKAYFVEKIETLKKT